MMVRHASLAVLAVASVAAAAGLNDSPARQAAQLAKRLSPSQKAAASKSSSLSKSRAAASKSKVKAAASKASYLSKAAASRSKDAALSKSKAAASRSKAATSKSSSLSKAAASKASSLSKASASKSKASSSKSVSKAASLSKSASKAGLTLTSAKSTATTTTPAETTSTPSASTSTTVAATATIASSKTTSSSETSAFSSTSSASSSSSASASQPTTDASDYAWAGGCYTVDTSKFSVSTSIPLASASADACLSACEDVPGEYFGAVGLRPAPSDASLVECDCFSLGGLTHMTPAPNGEADCDAIPYGSQDRRYYDVLSFSARFPDYRKGLPSLWGTDSLPTVDSAYESACYESDEFDNVYPGLANSAHDCFELCQANAAYNLMPPTTAVTLMGQSSLQGSRCLCSVDADLSNPLDSSLCDSPFGYGSASGVYGTAFFLPSDLKPVNHGTAVATSTEPDSSFPRSCAAYAEDYADMSHYIAGDPSNGSVSACSIACGIGYTVIGLLEPLNPSAQCFCLGGFAEITDVPNVASLDACDSYYGSDSMAYLSVFQVGA